MDLTPDLDGAVERAWSDERFGTLDQQLAGLELVLHRPRSWRPRRRREPSAADARHPGPRRPPR